jgi:long-chain fatty acid transport protein
MRKHTLLIAIALLVPALASASGFEVINTNPRDLGISASGVAAQRDAAATYQNPSALSKLEGLNLSLAGSMLSLHTEWTSSGQAGDPQGSSDTEFAPTPPVALYAAYGTKVGERGLGFGFGMGTPGGGQMHWEEDWQGRGRIITVERRMLGFYLNGGYEVLPWLRLGGGLVYYYGIQYLEQGIEPFSDAFGELDTKGGGFSFQLAGEVKPLENVTIGVDYKHKATMKMEGDGNFEVPPGIESAATQDQDVSQDLPFPNTLAIGVAWRATKAVQLTLQYNWSNFSVYEEDRFEGDAGLTLIVPRDYGDGNLVRGGVEWYTTPKLTLRAGMMYDWSGLTTDTLSPTLPDSDTLGFSGGASWAFTPDLAVHGALFYGDRLKQTATDDPATSFVAFPGSYKTNVWIASLGVTWRMGLGQ